MLCGCAAQPRDYPLFARSLHQRQMELRDQVVGMRQDLVAVLNDNKHLLKRSDGWPEPTAYVSREGTAAVPLHFEREFSKSKNGVRLWLCREGRSEYADTQHIPK